MDRWGGPMASSNWLTSSGSEAAGTLRLRAALAPSRRLPALEKSWHGGPPQMRSTRGRVGNRARSARSVGTARLRAYTFRADSQESTPSTTCTPASSSPRESPPAPQQRSMAVTVGTPPVSRGAAAPRCRVPRQTSPWHPRSGRRAVSGSGPLSRRTCRHSLRPGR
jgi:hypothetical protein